MSNSHHLATLKKGVDAWSLWREEFFEERPDLSKADLSGADLSGADLSKADLSHANLTGADLRKANLSRANLIGAELSEANLNEASLTGADLVCANLSGASLTEADLSYTDLEQGDLSQANLSEANLTGADLRKANLVKADLSQANLTGTNLSGADLGGADLSEARLTGAELSEANLHEANLYEADLWQAVIRLADLSDGDLRKAKGVQLDETFVRNARFSSNAPDHWSILRRNYTGPRLLFHLLLLLAFLSPYVIRTTWLVGLNEVQTEMKSFSERLQPIVQELKKDNHRSSVALGEMIDQMARVQPCLRQTCSETAIWKVLLGIDRVGVDGIGWGNVLLAVFLLIYNLCRGVLTWRVGPLREEEERSGYSPTYPGTDGYGWLFGFHRVVQLLLYVAGTSFLIHAWSWLTRTVWVLPI